VSVDVREVKKEGVERTRKRVERLIRNTATEELDESLRIELISRLIGMRELLNGRRENPDN